MYMYNLKLHVFKATCSRIRSSMFRFGTCLHNKFYFALFLVDYHFHFMLIHVLTAYYSYNLSQRNFSEH